MSLMVSADILAPAAAGVEEGVVGEAAIQLPQPSALPPMLRHSTPATRR